MQLNFQHIYLFSNVPIFCPPSKKLDWHVDDIDT